MFTANEIQRHVNLPGRGYTCSLYTAALCHVATSTSSNINRSSKDLLEDKRSELKLLRDSRSIVTMQNIVALVMWRELKSIKSKRQLSVFWCAACA